MKVAFCSSEVVPFAKTGGLADVTGALPIALEELGIAVTIIMPRYGCVDIKEHNLKRLNNTVLTATLGKNIQVFFIDNKKFFGKKGIYGNDNGDYDNNLERFQFFSKKSLEILKQLNIKADIIHCHDWHTALIPVYVKILGKDDPFYEKMKTVLTIHNLAYQGVFPKKQFSKLKLDKKYFTKDGFEFYGQVNLLKGGIRFCDVLTTVSEGYAEEIQTEEFGCGLNEDITSRGDPIHGIVNGIDTQYWDPKEDPLIEKRLDSDVADYKAVNKEKLQEQLGLALEPDIPVFSFIGRLDYQKGLELISQTIKRLSALDLQIVFLGTGTKKYQELLEDMCAHDPQKYACCLTFNEKLAHQIYAGSDIFLMPSRYEPCGLGQMISLRYGTVPLVFKTGGLSDTVTPFDDLDGNGNGFVFEKYSPAALADVVKRAVKVYQDKQKFNTLVEKALRDNFSWRASAEEYKRIYSQC